MLRKLRTIRSHAGHARFLAECASDAAGELQVAGTVRSADVPRDAYHFSPDRTVLVWNGRAVVVIESSHRCFQVWEVPSSMLVSATRAPLGTVVGRLLQELESDPIGDAYGVSAPGRSGDAIAREYGWSPAEIERELEVRGVSAHWVFKSGLGLVLDGGSR